MSDDDADGARQVLVNYVKATDYREVHCDGAIGGITPQGAVWIGFYAERMPIPRLTEMTLLPVEGGFQADNANPEKSIESKDGLLRAMQVGCYMDVASLESLYGWIGKQLERAEELRLKASDE